MILWDKTELSFGTNQQNTRKLDKVIAKCNCCHSELTRVYATVKNTMKRNNGLYKCHSCVTKNNAFKKGCSLRAKDKWRDEQYKNNNLRAVKSDEYRLKHKQISEKKWRDPEYKNKQLSEKAIKQRSISASKTAIKKWKDPEYRSKLTKILSDRAKRQWADDIYRDHMTSLQSSNTRKMWAEKRDKLLNTFRSTKFRQLMRTISSHQSEDIKERIGKASKALWANEAYRDRMLKILQSSEVKAKRLTTIRQRRNSEKFRQQLETGRQTRENRFISTATALNPQYNYSSVHYLHNKHKVDIICELHGKFSQTPNNHISKNHRCPACAQTQSRIHLDIEDFIKSLGYKTITNDRSLIHPYELDIVVPEIPLAIEVDGLYWHSYNHLETRRQIRRHSNKVDMAVAAGIRLICIRENEWNDKTDIIKSRLRTIVGISRRIYARCCKVIKISDREYKKFVIATHLQGYRSASDIYGLIYNNELVSIMSFSPHNATENQNNWEIMRFSTTLDTIVVGGASRLFKHFLNDISPKSVITYADRRYTTGIVYENMGFNLANITKPNYNYVKNSKIFSRQKFQKHKLPYLLANFDESLTEAENMFNNGYRRLWGAGHYKFIWK